VVTFTYDLVVKPHFSQKREKWGTLYCLLPYTHGEMWVVDQPDMSEFVTDIAFSFVFPIIVFLMGAGWNKTVGVTDPRIGKAWATFSLLLPVVILAMMTRYHSENIRAVWMMRPIAFSALFVLLAVLLLVVLIWLVVRIGERPESPEVLLPKSSRIYFPSGSELDPTPPRLPFVKAALRRFAPKLMDDTH
jgi:hypothetical protein